MEVNLRVYSKGSTLGRAKQLNKSAREHCSLCGCLLNRQKDTYGKDTVEGRSHASKHHHVAERFFGRTKNKKDSTRTREEIFKNCPWNLEKKSLIFCYDCHEELLHNPVLTLVDISDFKMLIKYHRFNEVKKAKAKTKIAGRIKLFHSIIRFGLDEAKRRMKVDNESSAAKETP